MASVEDERLLSPGEAAEYLGGVSLSTLNNWRCLRRGPKFVKFGTGRRALVRYRVSDLAAWLSERSVGTSDQPLSTTVDAGRKAGGR